MARTSPSFPSLEGSAKYSTSREDKSDSTKVPNEETQLFSKSSEKHEFQHYFRNFFSSTAFAITTCITLLSIAVKNVSTNTLILDKVCLLNLNYSSNVCANLNNYTDSKAAAEKMAANYILIHNILKLVPSIPVAFAAGKWSDKYGRKLFLVISHIGFTVEALGAYLCSYFEYARLEHFFITTSIMGISGGQLLFLTSVYSYISDSTIVQKRTMQYGFYEILLGISQPLSIAVGGWIYNYYGYSIVFLVSTCGFVVNIIWIMLFLPETRGVDNTDPWSVKFRSFFSCSSLIDSVSATVKKREDNGRRLIWLLTIANCIVYSASIGTIDINYLYTHHQFNWGNAEYSKVLAFFLMGGVLSLLLVLPLLKHFRVRDPIIGIIGVLSIAAKNLVISLANKTTIFYAANVLGLLSSSSTMSIRSSLSKVMPNDERGKLFTFVVISESIFPILLTAVVTQLFNAFLEIFPGMPYIFLIIMLIQPFATLVWILYRKLPVTEKETKETSKDAADGNLTA